MLYPTSFEEKIGFDSIRNWLQAHCVSDMGKSCVDKMKYATNIDEITTLLSQVNEYKSVLLFEDNLSIQDFHNLSDTLTRIAIDGTYIELDELADLQSVILSVIQTVVYFRILHEEEKYPYLWAICENIFLEKTLSASIRRIIDEKGNLRDNASDELRRIKSAIIQISNEADKKIKKLLSQAKQDGIAKEDAEMTIRNGRLCIPVQAQFKRRLQGFIHDESASGQTVFIEPTDVFAANNELKDLLNAEKREIIRILTTITDEIRISIPNLRIYHDFMGTIDFIRSKALLAIEINAVFPHLFENQIINWSNATHPLLFLKFKKLGKRVEPLSIELTPEHRILIISGPNAGGKSVCLKTIGLLQYMMQCGLLVSMDETSDMSLFTDFFIDMGDEQSIENDLSTYSSHLRNLKIMIENLNERSLFLIDEFGSGTEPHLGGAMAEAILENIYHKNPFGIITTHYGNLKMFPDRFPKAVNGAMLFDTNRLKPLFMLKIGNPGSSFTYEIARQIGFPEEIIQNAIQKSGTAQIDYERKLEEIEIAKIEIEQKLKLVRSADEHLAEMIQDYGDKFGELEKQRKDILQNAKNQANSIIDSANKVIEKTIREIKEAKAETEKTKQIRQEIAKVKVDLKKEIEWAEDKESLKPVIPVRHLPTRKKEMTNEDTTLHVGDSVFLADIQTVGEITALNGQDVTVSFNAVSFKTKISKVMKISKKEAKSVQKHGIGMNGGTLSEVMNKKVAAFHTTLDLRGHRADEAVLEVESYLDEALLISIHQVRLLHGKGNGILRNVIRQYLSKRKEVVAFRDEQLELGGYGITVVDL